MELASKGIVYVILGAIGGALMGAAYAFTEAQRKANQ